MAYLRIALGLFAFSWVCSGLYLSIIGVSLWHLNRCVRKNKLHAYPKTALISACTLGVILGPLYLFIAMWISEKENWLYHEELVKEYDLLIQRSQDLSVDILV